MPIVNRVRLSAVRGGFETPLGSMLVRWTQGGFTFVLGISTPQSTVGTVTLRLHLADSLMEDSQVLTPVFMSCSSFRRSKMSGASDPLKYGLPLPVHLVVTSLIFLITLSGTCPSNF